MYTLFIIIYKFKNKCEKTYDYPIIIQKTFGKLV